MLSVKKGVDKTLGKKNSEDTDQKIHYELFAKNFALICVVEIYFCCYIRFFFIFFFAKRWN